MRTQQDQEASPAGQSRVGFRTCVGVVIVFLGVVSLVTASGPREVVLSCVPLLLGTKLVLPGGERSGRAVRAVSVVLFVGAAALVVVGLTVL